MKVTLLSPNGKKVLDGSGGEVLLDDLHAVIEIASSESEAVTLSMNNEEYEVSAGVDSTPVCLTNEYDCRLVIRSSSDTVSYYLKFPGGARIDLEHLANLMHLTETLRLINEYNGEQGVPVKEILNEQKRGGLSLLCVVEPLTGYDNDDLQDRLKRDLSQKVRAICSRPKRGTRTEEIVQDVGLVKKTSTNTLEHLASHTEHWMARTLTSLRPKRLLSVVIEDELNIYENLFFRSAVNEISDYVDHQLNRLEKASQQKRNASNFKKYADQMNDWKRARIFEELLPAQNKARLDFFNAETLDHYQRSIDAWEDIDALLRNIRNSSFYRQISRKQRFPHEIYLTNILRNDQRYHALYDLLIAVRREAEREAETHAGESNLISGNPDHFYANYVVVLFLWCMARKLDISFAEDSCLALDDQDRLTGVLSAEDDVITYRIAVDYDRYNRPSVKIDLMEKGDQSFKIPGTCPVTSDMMEQFKGLLDLKDGWVFFFRRPNADERNRLRNLFHQKKAGGSKQSIYAAAAQDWPRFVDNLLTGGKVRDLHQSSLIIRPLYYAPDAKDHLLKDLMDGEGSEGNDTLWIVADGMSDTEERDSRLKYIINYGELPVSEDSKPYHHGVLPVMQVDSLSSQRIIKYFTIKRAIALMNWEKENPVHCPVCLSDDIFKSGKDSWHCRTCDNMWGMTRCKGDGGCKRDFSWIWPDDDHLKSLRDEDVRESSDIRHAQRRDIVFGAGIITDFEYDYRGNGEIVPLPICPYCGKKRPPKDSLRPGSSE